MRAPIFLALILSVANQAFTQSPPSPDLPKDPHELLAMAAPYYDFNDPTLKPWHFKATYQLYDENGKPTGQGTYEYWWASPKVHRSTWTRPGATHTDWYTADGKHAYQDSGEGLQFFEYKIQSALFSPLPDPSDLDPTKVRLDRESLSSGGTKFPCVMSVSLEPSPANSQKVPMGLFPTYCFDPKTPVLRLSASFAALHISFDKIVKVQNKYLAREIAFYEGKNKILSATVDVIEDFDSSDAVLVPPTGAHFGNLRRVYLPSSLPEGSVLKKQAPVYPRDALEARVSGTVVVEATIGMEGRIHDLRVVSTPWPSLATAALDAVSKWQYKPFQQNGEPVEVDAELKVIFMLRK